MAFNGYIVPALVDASDRRILNRSAINATVDMENGGVVQLLSLSTDADKKEVWVATQAAATTGLQNLWMVYTDPIPETDGKYKGLDPDPRNFINKAGRVFSAFKPQVGDVVWFAEDAVGGSKATGDYAVATASQWQLQWASAAVSGLTFHVVGTEYQSIADGSIGTQRVTMYKCECTAIA